MALVTTDFSINITPGAMPPVVHVSEYDIGRSYTVGLIGENNDAFTIPTGTTATIEGTLNGVVGFSVPATISNNKVTFTLTESMTAKAGRAWCKIKLTQNSQPIQTCAFVLAVDRAGVEAETVIGAPGFEEQIQNAVDNYLDEHPVGVEVDPTLSIEGAAADAKATGKIKTKLTLKESNNLSRSDSDWTSGYYVDNGNGNVIASSTLSYSDYIPVNEGDVIRLYDLYGGLFENRQMRAVATYDGDKGFVRNPDSTGWKVQSYTVTSGIKYVRISAPTATQYMITKNYEPTVFEPWFEPYYVATDDFVVDAIDDVKTTDLKNEIAFALPQTTFRQTVGLAQTWYKHSMVTPSNPLISVNASYANTVNEANGFTFENESVLDSPNGFVWFAHDPYMNLLKYFDNNTGYGAARKVIAENLANCTLMAIGDSTVDSDDMTGSLLDYFASKGKTLTLLGTLGKSGSSTNKNEGRAGWTTSDYMTNSTKNGYTNPFYNSSTGGFDFSYYMTQQGYSGVDFVVIQLGINDLYPKTARLDPEPDYAAIWSNVATMIDSIRAYNSNIKIIINLPTTPNSDPSSHHVAEYLYNHYVVKYNEYALAQIQTYASGVRASYCHLILDPATDIRDNVHPTAAGYAKMAMELVNQINVWQNGA